MTAPVDPTTTAAWSRLTSAATTLDPDLRGWFAADPSRAQRFSFDCADLHVDLSKNLLTDDVLAALVDLGRAVGLESRRDAMFAGERINVTEGRSVLHTALRRPAEATGLVLDGQGDVHEVLAAVYAFADKVRSGEWRRVTGKRIRTIVQRGDRRFGSRAGHGLRSPGTLCPARADLPVHLQHRPDRRRPENGRFGPRDDPRHRREQDLHDAQDNHQRSAGAGLVARLACGVGRDRRGRSSRGPAPSPSTSSPCRPPWDKVAAFGIDPANAFGFWDWVGGRYSVDSAIGTAVAVAIGPERFADLLAGFHAVDEHFRTTPLERNVPALMGLLNVWYVNHLDARSHAVLPLCPATAPVRGIPAAVDDGVQREVSPLGRVPGDHRDG